MWYVVWRVGINIPSMHLPPISDSVKKLQDQKHDMEREIKILHRRLRVRELQRDTGLLEDHGRLEFFVIVCFFFF